MALWRLEARAEATGPVRVISDGSVLMMEVSRRLPEAFSEVHLAALPDIYVVSKMSVSFGSVTPKDSPGALWLVVGDLSIYDYDKFDGVMFKVAPENVDEVIAAVKRAIATMIGINMLLAQVHGEQYDNLASLS